jgi:hypothetical protein
MKQYPISSGSPTKGLLLATITLANSRQTSINLNLKSNSKRKSFWTPKKITKILSLKKMFTLLNSPPDRSRFRQKKKLLRSKSAEQR